MSRLINNQIWNARTFSLLSVEDKLLYLYLETSPETNYYGVFMLPNDNVISARTGLSVQKVQKSLQELQDQNKILIIDDYIIIFDYFDRQKNNGSEKTRKGLEKFELSLPENVKTAWLKGRAYPLNGGIEGVSSPHEENKVNKSKIKESKVKENKIKEKADLVLEKYNQIYKTKLKSTVSWINNLGYWLNTYNIDDILEAVESMNNPNWWPNHKRRDNPNMPHPTLDLLFRTENKNGNCDYIAELTLLRDRTNQPINTQPTYAVDLKF